MPAHVPLFLHHWIFFPFEMRLFSLWGGVEVISIFPWSWVGKDLQGKSATINGLGFCGTVCVLKLGVEAFGRAVLA